MTVEVHSCDRCKRTITNKEGDYYSSARTIQILRMDNKQLSYSANEANLIDLCEQCVISLKHWLIELNPHATPQTPS